MSESQNHPSVVGVMKMGNVVTREGLEPTSLGQCATIRLCRFPDVTTIPMPTCVCGPLPKRSAQTTTLLYNIKNNNQLNIFISKAKLITETQNHRAMQLNLPNISTGGGG